MINRNMNGILCTNGQMFVYPLENFRISADKRTLFQNFHSHSRKLGKNRGFLKGQPQNP